MKTFHLILSVAPLALAAPSIAATNPAPVSAPDTDAAAPAPATADVVTTGVARGRDRLDSAVSTSVLKQEEIQKLAPRSVAEILRDIPGIRASASTGEGNGSFTIRGLPIAANGAKFVQLQEDGLPILEFGDMFFSTADSFLRADLNLAQVDVIRGGSASTFASNSPGGIINFISKTGEVEGGAVQVGAGLDYDDYRLDFDYGTHVSDTLRFHVGGFFRQGEGPRRTGYDAVKGGQIKLNVTKDFAGGYIRFYGKYLDDRTPYYDVAPMRVTGTDAKPSFASVPGFVANKDTFLSRYIPSHVTLDENNNLVRDDIRDGQHVVVKSAGIETQFDVQGWTIGERFRYSGISNHVIDNSYQNFLPAAAASLIFGAPGATLRYASGPNTGQAITDPAGLNGNGLLAASLIADTKAKNLDNVTNDLRASRVWKVGRGDLTTTLGIYNARQTASFAMLWTVPLTDVRGDGRAALVDLGYGPGRMLTQDGFLGFDISTAKADASRVAYQVDYSINAPFASVNYRIGRLSIGGSLRYDFGRASGARYSATFSPGVAGTVRRDMNGDGVISFAERAVGVIPLANPAPVDYGFHYLSYSTGLNFRIAEPLAVFARYSRGGRVNADRILPTPLVDFVDGHLDPSVSAVDYVHQAETGVKYRDRGLTLNLTGFWARADDTNFDPSGVPLAKKYRATGLEFEGGYRTGIFGLNGGATYTHGKIVKDRINPQLEGNTPRQQPKLIFQATPQISNDRFAVGAVFIGTTGSFAQDSNLLKMPGYVTTNAFVQVRPVDRLLLSLNANNLFDVTAITAIDEPTIGVLATGTHGSPVRIAPEWRGAPPPHAAVTIATARGVDLHPLDVGDAATRERLLSYVFADQPARAERLCAAIALARDHPPRIDRADAATWLVERLAEPQSVGRCRVVFHSMVMQYLDVDDRRTVAAAIAAAGQRADADRPLAHIALEWTAARDAVQVWLTCWPDSEPRHLANCHPYGAWIDWTGG